VRTQLCKKLYQPNCKKPVLPVFRKVNMTQIFSLICVVPIKLLTLQSQLEQDAINFKLCDQINVTVSDEEWQGRRCFSLKHKITGFLNPYMVCSTTNQRRLSEGIKLWLRKKVKRASIKDVKDNHYISNRDNYQRVTLSQILVNDSVRSAANSQFTSRRKSFFCAL